ncbi:MAG: PKD domain-containing protein, partial [Acidobacteria bacterium]|nr:PKD domain-containing protein [Acidobacteriota bacterium]
PITFTVGLIESTVSIERYEWEFGDGTITLTTTGPSVAHPYTTPGDKNVSVTVVPSAAVSRRTSTVVVITVPPSGGGH